MQLDRSSQAYIEAVIQKKSQDDPKEIVIREKIAACVLAEPWAQQAIDVVRTQQKEYLQKALEDPTAADRVHDLTQAVLHEISDTLHASIVEGGEYLDHIAAGSPALIMTNHFGAYKLCGVKTKDDLGVDIEGYDAMYPFPLYFAALYPVAERLRDGLYYSSEDFPGVFGTIHSNAGLIHVPPSSIPVEGGRTKYLVNETRRAIDRRPHSAIVNFPEGGTSGKYTGLSPYDLDPFKTGGYVIAAQLEIPVIPVAQYFDPKGGFQLKVFEPFTPPVGEKDAFEKMAENDRMQMQRWLNERRAA